MAAVPQVISLSAAALGLDAHPRDRDVLATGRVDGIVNVWRLDRNQWVSGVTSSHGASAREVRFTADGETLLAARADGTVTSFDVATQELLSTVHATSVQQSKGQTASVPGLSTMMTLEGALCVTGDDEGGVQAWDSRTPSSLVCQAACRPQTDYIAALDVLPCQDGSVTTLAASADGTLAVLDWRALDWRPLPDAKPDNQKRSRKKKKNDATKPVAKPGWTTCAVSEDVEDELLSMVVLKHGSKVVCGSQEGVIQIYSTGAWMDVTDRFPGHPKSVEAIVKIDEETVLTGSSDGLVRVVQIQPNRLLGVIGQHADFPIEKMKRACDASFLATSSHDDIIRFHDLSVLVESEGSVNSGSDIEESGKGSCVEERGIEIAMPEAQQSESDSDELPRATKLRKTKKKKIKDTAPSKFFDGL